MAHSYSVAGDLANQPRTSADPELPADVVELIHFLRDASSLGTQVAFWRSKAKIDLLQSASFTLRAASLTAQADIKNAYVAKARLDAYGELYSHLDRIVEAVPFHAKVGLLRRNLIGVFQLLFILRHLSQCILCRLKLQLGSAVPTIPAGSLLSQECKREHRDSLRAAARGWEQESWNVYDYL
ncbi:MAG: hypothetical protein MUF01_01225 [Bryobacterales bacterium]|jgi:hypothetical protein|nr:hypothetical protein [Bryobacterales bacterium]